MRRLIVLRHAKSSWDDPGLDDIDRPLNQRGLKNAPEMGRRLRREGRVPERICTSPARRARETTRLVAGAMGLREESICTAERIYPGELAGLLGVIHGFGDEHACVMMVGHNPALTELVNALAGSGIDNVPTAGYAEIHFECASWADVQPGTGRLARFDYPKSGKK